MPFRTVDSSTAPGTLLLSMPMLSLKVVPLRGARGDDLPSVSYSILVSRGRTISLRSLVSQTSEKVLHLDPPPPPDLAVILLLSVFPSDSPDRPEVREWRTRLLLGFVALPHCLGTNPHVDGACAQASR